ncbi:kinase [Thraustotheca clavata]|uniref:Kinase n=1 Tax=Thraustotheca clavata TaxID=74557 RepID=A0A1V9Y8Z0_9STRA|nr:kinase [Thraustotheca clavata]
MIFGERVTPKYDRRRTRDSFPKEIVIHERMQTPPPKDDVVGIHLDLGDLELWRIDTSDLVSYRLLAKGAHGEVWIGEYKAIKKLLANEQTAQGIQKFIDEIKLTTKLDSPFITKFIGASWLRPREMELVMEYMENGDLRNYLETTKESTKFPWKQKVQCIQDICDGLVYLHSLHVIHRDLKSRNVLLGVNLEAKLTDFGISREISNETMTHGVVGTYRWIAPEILQGDRYTVAADIYSFGVILSEFDSHSIPYHGALNEKGLPLTEITLLNLVRDGAIKPYYTNKCLPWVYELAMQCLETDPSKRPKAPEIAAYLRRNIRQAQFDHQLSGL